MNRIRVTLTSILVALLCTLVPAAAHASDLQTLTEQAQQAASAGKTARALGLYELALSQAATQPESVFGPLDGLYWHLIVQTDDFPRAFNFFTALASQQENPDANLLASRANAIGSYIGWLYQNQIADDLPPAAVPQLDATARRNYARALALDPDNFTALYGYAIYESYRPGPNSKAHMQQLLTKLNSLRASRPHYPWPLVDYLQQHGHPQL
jgi:hypothetical protein